MTVEAHAEAQAAQSGTPYTRRARYVTSENPFTFEWPPVPIRQFLPERDRAFDPATPTGEIPLDASSDLGTRYPATTPTLLVRYLKLRAGERLRTSFAAGGEIYYVMAGAGESRNGNDAIAWGVGDVYCFPGGSETVHRAGRGDCRRGDQLHVADRQPLAAAPRDRAARLGARPSWKHRRGPRRLRRGPDRLERYPAGPPLDRRRADARRAVGR